MAQSGHRRLHRTCLLFTHSLLARANSPPISVMPIMAMPIRVPIRAVGISAVATLLKWRVSPAHRFAVTVPVRRCVWPKVRKALSERDSRRAQEHRKYQNECFHDPISNLLFGKHGKQHRCSSRTLVSKYRFRWIKRASIIARPLLAQSGQTIWNSMIWRRLRQAKRETKSLTSRWSLHARETGLKACRETA